MPAALLKARLQAAREAAAKNLREKSGDQICREYCRSVDVLLREHFRRTLAQTPAAGRFGGGVALLALGGYGRRDLCLFSDLDLLFVFGEEPGGAQEDFIKRFFHPLWDVGVTVGHSTHSLDSALGLVGENLDSTTALMEGRFLAGGRPLAGELARRLQKRLRTPAVARWYLETLLADLQKRHEKHGGSPYVLEPHIKEGVGGMRDLQAMLWLTCMVCGEASLATAARRGLLAPAQARSLRGAYTLLLKIRNALHHLERRKCDHLTFERQVKIAHALGCRRSENALPEENLMRDYYKASSLISASAQRYRRALQARVRYLAPPAAGREAARKVAGPFRRQGEFLYVEPRDAGEFRRDPDLILKAFALAAGLRLRVREDTRDAIAAAAPHADAAFRSSPVNRDLFLGILRNPRDLYRTLRDMMDCGALIAYIPEFAMVRHLPRIDFYHHYAVDEHLLRTTLFSERLLSGPAAPGGRSDPSLAHVSRVARTIRRWDLLNFTLILHDIGKGEGRGHVLRGGHLISRIAERMGLAEADRELCRRLTLNHQKMSQLAFQRNVEDPKVAQELADELGERETLRMLYAMTVCDLLAVGETAWNDWKSKLLTELYERTRAFLLARRSSALARERSGLTAQQVAEVLGQHGALRASDVETFLSSMPDRYRLSTSPSEAARHFALARRITPEEPVQWRLDLTPNADCAQLTVATSDAPGVFSHLCGALSSRAINILSAQIYTADDGLCVDVFQVQDQRRRAVEDGPWLERLRKKLIQVVAGKAAAPWEAPPAAGAPSIPPSMFTPERLAFRPPTVSFNNNASAHHTVIEIKAHDKPGLLYGITRAMARERINIDLAIISTEAYRVVDVFYVTDWDNNKLEDERLLARLREALLSAAGGALPGFSEAPPSSGASEPSSQTGTQPAAEEGAQTPDIPSPELAQPQTLSPTNQENSPPCPAAPE